MLTLIIVESLSFTSCHSRSFSAKTESQKLSPGNRDSESTAAISNIWSMSKAPVSDSKRQEGFSKEAKN